MRLLFDTNVFLDLYLGNSNSVEVEKLLLLCSKQNHEIYLTTMSIRDIGYILQKYLHDKKKCRAVQLNLYQLCNKVVSVSADALIETLYSDSADFEDGLIIEAANESMCDAIITSDLKGFLSSNIPVYSLKDINHRLSILEPVFDNF